MSSYRYRACTNISSKPAHRCSFLKDALVYAKKKEKNLAQFKVNILDGLVYRVKLSALY